ncbi:MAG: hypothetical protein FWD68_18630 [Alphaproteobacteria bacterium]|nr:hypothetical protein [Alphaproteobacteria bacterium]
MTEPSEMNADMQQSLICIVVESWRFARLFCRVVNRLDEIERGRHISQLRYFERKIDESLSSNGMKIVNVEGHPYDAGMAAAALNLADFGPDDVLVVDQMLEPIIMGSDGLLRQGTVMLRKAGA